MAGVDVLAIGPHPDDVELGCGGTLAKLARAGRRVGILHLSCGEAGTLGTSAERRREAERAASELGAAVVEFVDFGDGAMRTGADEEDQLIEVLRRLTPDLVFAAAPRDRHPDHGRTHHLVADACFYAGLKRRGRGKPHRPAALFAYMQHDPFEPSFVVDVTATWRAKMKALDAYESQLHAQNAAKAAAPERRRAPAPALTKISSREFRLAVEGRARHFGLLIGAEFGEAFWSRLPLAVADPWQILPAGIR